MYQFDLIYIIYLLLPTFLRKPVMVYFMEALLKPIESLYTIFLALKNDLNYWLGFTGQLIYLEYLLKQKFSGYDIIIQDGTLSTSSFISHYPNSDSFLGHIADNNTLMISHSNNSIFVYFIVQVPASLYDNMSVGDFDRMNAIIQKYKLIDKTYRIERI